MGKRTERNPTGEKIGMAKIPGVEEGKKDLGNSDPEVSRQQWLTMAVLVFVNLINYMGRLTLAGVLDLVRQEFDANDARAGILQTAFIISYMLFAPVFGYLGNWYSRKYLSIPLERPHFPWLSDLRASKKPGQGLGSPRISSLSQLSRHGHGWNCGGQLLHYSPDYGLQPVCERPEEQDARPVLLCHPRGQRARLHCGQRDCQGNGQLGLRVKPGLGVVSVLLMAHHISLVFFRMNLSLS